jgi:hypothetical protein
MTSSSSGFWQVLTSASIQCSILRWSKMKKTIWKRFARFCEYLELFR